MNQNLWRKKQEKTEGTIDAKKNKKNISDEPLFFISSLILFFYYLFYREIFRKYRNIYCLVNYFHFCRKTDRK